MTRTHHFRAVRVRLECGCTADLHTSRYRVTKAVVFTIVGDHVRRGVWCLKCKGLCQLEVVLGVVRAE